jgi:uncharacterized protein
MMLRAAPSGVTLAVRAQPGAKKTAIIGIYGEGARRSSKLPCKPRRSKAARMKR